MTQHVVRKPRDKIKSIAQQAPMEIVGLIGNAVGAQTVNTLGH